MNLWIHLFEAIRGLRARGIPKSVVVVLGEWKGPGVEHL